MAKYQVTMTGNSDQYEIELQQGSNPVTIEAANTYFEIDSSLVPSNPWSDPFYFRIKSFAGFHIRNVVSDNSSIDPTMSSDTLWEDDSLTSIYSDTVINIEVTLENDDGTDIGPQEPEFSSPFNKVYLVTPDVVRDIGGIVEQDYNNQQIDLSQFVIKLLEIPFKVPDDLVGVEVPIYIGPNEQQTIKAPDLEVDKIQYDLGSIEVSGIGNSLDYMNKTYDLVIPMINGLISLNPSDVVGNSIKILMRLDVYSGDVSINLYKNDEVVPFKTEKSTVGRSVPIHQAENITASNHSGELGVFNDTMTAYIRVYESELFNSEFNNLISTSGILGSYIGYVKFEEINLICSGVSDEKEMIINQLMKGVEIK